MNKLMVIKLFANNYARDLLYINKKTINFIIPDLELSFSLTHQKTRCGLSIAVVSSVFVIKKKVWRICLLD